MISLLLALAAAPAQPLQPVTTVHPNLRVLSLQDRRQRTTADARELLARAERLSATYRPAPGQPTKAELDARRNELKSDLDSLSEMSEMDSLRLQMAMDRMSKLMSTLSNLLKKAGETQQGIVQNIK